MGRRGGAIVTPPLKPGTHVRFTMDSLGAVLAEGPWHRFVERTYGHGDTGVVDEVIPAPDWLYVVPDDDATLLVPVTTDMVEVITESQ